MNIPAVGLKPEGRPPQEVTDAKTRKRKKHNWSIIGAEYISAETQPGLRVLAKKYDVKYSQIYERSHRDRWVQKKKQYWEDVYKAAIEERQKDQVERQKRNLNAIRGSIIEFMRQVQRHDVKGTFKDLPLLLELEAKVTGIPLEAPVENKPIVVKWMDEPKPEEPPNAGDA